MNRPIVRDIFFLGQKSDPASRADLPVGQDLQDTLNANRDRCAGMAANMIGVRKRIIIVSLGFVNLVMYNPVIVNKSGPYQAEEGCLSLSGVRKTTRYENIEVEYLDSSWKKHRESFSGWTAQIIQHEADHLEGILI
ncbi:MAG: peptide deformylase [Lachnospiraceae bacterium]|nr:peptide deformylase [Lachnospiraceae bacterium]